MDFYQMIGKITSNSVFKMEGYHVWCGSVVKHEENYYMLFSRWSSKLGHNAWVTNSEVCWAVSKNACGPYKYGGLALAGNKSGWDANVIHNPVVIEHEGKYYMYYTGTHGKEDWWDFRNNQCIGVAVADDPTGPWIRRDKPIVDVTKDSWDCLMISNPTVTKGNDGKFYMMYKGVGEGEMPKGGKVLVGMAVSEKPIGPFVKTNAPCIVNPEHDWAVEDPFIWFYKNKFYAIIKDFQGYFSKGEKGGAALFESDDGLKWRVSENSLAIKLELKWEDGHVQKVERLERPQLFIENNKITALICACLQDGNTESYNVQIPIIDAV